IKRMLLPLVIILQKKSFLAKMNPASTVVNAYNLLLDLDGDLTGEFKKVKVDTWIIGGSKDPLFTREIFDEAKEIKKDFHLKIIEGAGHLLDMDKPKEFKKVIHEILSS
ncbi:MAG: alpha/beta fold hydrolase, partial [Candidatus Hodarchaeota archaeon]